MPSILCALWALLLGSALGLFAWCMARSAAPQPDTNPQILGLGPISAGALGECARPSKLVRLLEDDEGRKSVERKLQKAKYMGEEPRPSTEDIDDWLVQAQLICSHLFS
jgi:hypothetical protein